MFWTRFIFNISACSINSHSVNYIVLATRSYSWIFFIFQTIDGVRNSRV